MKLRDKIALGTAIAGVVGIGFGYKLICNSQDKIHEVESRPLISEYNALSRKLNSSTSYAALEAYRNDSNKWEEFQKDFNRYNELAINPTVVSDQNDVKNLYHNDGFYSKILTASLLLMMIGLGGICTENATVVFPQRRLDDKITA